MESKKYIISKLQELHNIFPKLAIRYKYDTCSSMHIVDIMPLDEYKNNQEYIMRESDLSYEFDNIFYPESVMFVSAESLTKIDNPEFSIDPVVVASLTSEDYIDLTDNLTYSVESNDAFTKTNQHYHLAA